MSELIGCVFADELVLDGPGIGNDIESAVTLLAPGGAAIGEEFCYEADGDTVFGADVQIVERDTRREFDDRGRSGLIRTLPSEPGEYTFPVPVDVSTAGGDRVAGTVYVQLLRLVSKLACTVEIDINKTAVATDDLVQLMCTNPAKRFTVPCRVRLARNAPADKVVVLGNPDGRLRFPQAADTTKQLTMPKSGAWVDFEISGETASKQLGDAIIEVREDTAVGNVCLTKPVTVFSFDEAEIDITAGQPYAFFTRGDFRFLSPAQSPIVSYSATARLRPAGVDCTAPQVKDLRIGIAQNTKAGGRVAFTGSNPTVACAPGFTGGVLVQPNVVATLSFPAANDTSAAKDPVYARTPAALRPPVGCPNGGPASTMDTPLIRYPVRWRIPLRAGTTVIATYEYQLDRIEYRASFTAWTVVLNTADDSVCTLREREWRFDADSSNVDQRPTRAVVGATSRPPTTPLQTGSPFANEEGAKARPVFRFTGRGTIARCPS